MRAAMLTENGVQVQDAPKPSPKPNEVLVRVRAGALNRADLTVASGAAHGGVGGAGTIIGMEFSGEIAELGAEAATHGLATGDRVMCYGAAAWAEYAVTDWGRVMKIPDANVSFERAATLPIALNTMHNALVTNGGLQKGESVMIQGASSGVGIMGMQIAKYMGASLVIGSSTNAERRAKLMDYGCDLAVDSSASGWADQVLEATGGDGVNLIVDQLSGYVANENMRAAAIKGRIVNVGRLGGATGEFDFNLHALRRIQYIGVTFRTRSPDEVRAVGKATQEDLGAAIASGDLSLPIDKTYPLEQVADALAHMEVNGHFGKIILNVD